MKISTKGCYGLRAMIQLARAYGGGPQLMRDIAERESISRKYLHALLSALRAAGLVRSIRGAGGGYLLSKHPRDIRVSDVIQALEGSLAVAGCVQDRSICEHADGCISLELWRELSLALEAMLGKVTLEDLVHRHRESDGSSAMYFI